MRQRAVSSVLLAVVLACSEHDNVPTETRPELATAPPGNCTTAPTLTAPAPISIAAGSTGQSRFWLLKNNCGGSPSGPWDFSAGRTGAVASVGSPSPLFVTSIPGGGTAKISVPFTAGASAGSGTVVFHATNDGLGPLTLTKSQTVTVTAGAGVPFGPSDLFETSSSFRQQAPFTWTTDGTDAGHIITQINTARAAHIKFALVMTGGGSVNYVTNGKFDFAKWKARQNTFDTPEIQSAVAAGVSDGTIPFAVLIDEPNRSDWGGNVHHSTLDSMSRHTKSIFPTLRTGVDVTHTWENTVIYQSVDIMTTQFAGTEKSGDVNTYRTQAVASAARQKVALFFSLNIINGGKKPVNGSCPSAQMTGSTEGGQLKGCKMTEAEMQTYGDALLQAAEACGLKMWKYDLPTLTPTGDLMARSQAAFDHLAATAKAHAARPCVKPA